MIENISYISRWPKSDDIPPLIQSFYFDRGEYAQLKRDEYAFSNLSISVGRRIILLENYSNTPMSSPRGEGKRLLSPLRI